MAGLENDVKVDVARSYGSELSDRGTGLELRFVVLPRDSLRVADAPPEILESLELRPVSEELSPEVLAFAIASVLLNGNDADRAAEHFQLVLEHRELFALDHSDVLAFAEYAANENVVPIEHSPLSADSLVSLLGGSGAGVGLGLMVAGGPTPLLLITVPAGIILVGTATGIAEGLNEGLRYRIKRLFGVPQ